MLIALLEIIDIALWVRGDCKKDGDAANCPSKCHRSKIESILIVPHEAKPGALTVYRSSSEQSRSFSGHQERDFQKGKKNGECHLFEKEKKENIVSLYNILFFCGNSYNVFLLRESLHSAFYFILNKDTSFITSETIKLGGMSSQKN